MVKTGMRSSIVLVGLSRGLQFVVGKEKRHASRDINGTQESQDNIIIDTYGKNKNHR